jgi:hypothetical protein
MFPNSLSTNSTFYNILNSGNVITLSNNSSYKTCIPLSHFLANAHARTEFRPCFETLLKLF